MKLHLNLKSIGIGGIGITSAIGIGQRFGICTSLLSTLFKLHISSSYFILKLQKIYIDF